MERKLLDACRDGNFDAALQLISKEQCDPKAVIDQKGWTPLHYACNAGNLEFAKALIESYSCDPGCTTRDGLTPLHLACKNGQANIVRYLLSDRGCDANSVAEDGSTLLSVTHDPTVIRQLLRHGANPENVYIQYGSHLPKHCPKQPKEASVKIFTVGDPGAGKTTLVKALEKEGKGLSRITNRLTKVFVIDQKTAGIIPHRVESRTFGNVILYDFAGHKEFYASHAAMIRQSMAGSSGAIFLVLADLQSSGEDFKRSILSWLSFIDKQCPSVDPKPHIIIVGSHADEIKSKAEIAKKSATVDSLVPTAAFTNLYFTGYVTINCCYSESTSISELRQHLARSCEALRIKSQLNFNTHCFLLYLLDKFQDVQAFKLKEVLIKDSESSTQAATTSDGNALLSFIPTESPDKLYKMCEDLHERGSILLFRNTEKPKESWVILDQATLLSQVTGTVFAPEGFKQHRDLASSTGVVPFSKLQAHFPDLDPNMIAQFLCYLEFCQEVSDDEVLQFLQTFDTPLSIKERFFFFPGLVSIDASTMVWKPSDDFVYHSGWMLQCPEPEHFFTPRFLQVLLLRLAFFFALTPDTQEIKENLPTIQRKCDVWKSGVCWYSRSGVGALVEVDHSKTVNVLLRCLKGREIECIHLRSAIIHKALCAKEEFCPKVSTSEYFIHPTDAIQYPLKPTTDINLFSISIIANAIVTAEPYVIGTDRLPLDLEKLLYFEPYINLSVTVLQKLFDEQQSSYDKEVTDEFMHQMAQCAHTKVEHFVKMFSMFKPPIHNVIEQATPSSTHAIIRLFQRWRLQSRKNSYQCLRRELDQFSVFAGRNPLDLMSSSLPALPTDVAPTVVDPATDDHSSILQSVDETALGIASLLEVRAELKEATPFWMDLGLALGLLQHTLQSITLQNSEDVGQCLTETLAAWLQGKDGVAAPTWRAIVEALLSPTINFYRLALRIADTRHHGRSDIHSSTTAIKDHTLQYVDDVPLDDSSLGDVKTALLVGGGPLSWFDLGLTLGLCYNSLKEIQVNGDTYKEHLTATLAAWLRQKDRVPQQGLPSWRSLTRALAHPLLSQQGLAEEIARKYQLKARAELSLDDLGDVKEELYKARTKWYDVGLKLKVLMGTLDSIRVQYYDPGDQLCEMLKPWLKGAAKSRPKWEVLVEVLRSPLIEEPNLADHLEGKYCRSEAKSSQAPVKHPAGDAAVGHVYSDSESTVKRPMLEESSEDVAHDQLAHKRDKIIRYLAACVSPESLADKFLVAGLISVAIWNKAFVSGATNLEKIRPMIDVIIVKTELNAAKYYKTFIDVLKEFGDLEDVIEFIESPKYSSSAPVKHPAGGATVGRVYSDIKSSAKRPNPQSAILPSDKLALSNLPYDEYVAQFGQLFTVRFDVREEIIHAVFGIKTEDIIGISVGGKTITEGIYKEEVRPCVVVLVKSTEKIPELIPQIVEKVISNLEAKHHKKYYEENEDPHWLKFAKHTDKHEQVELLSGSETNDANTDARSTSLPVKPGMLIETSPENFGTVGLFIKVNVTYRENPLCYFHHGLTNTHVLIERRTINDGDYQVNPIRNEIVARVNGTQVIKDQFQQYKENITLKYDDCMAALSLFPHYLEQLGERVKVAVHQVQPVETLADSNPRILGSYGYSIWGQLKAFSNVGFTFDSSDAQPHSSSCSSSYTLCEVPVNTARDIDEQSDPFPSPKALSARKAPSSDWYTLGKELEVPIYKLDQIKHNHPSDSNRKEEVLKYWRKSRHPRVRPLVAALLKNYEYFMKKLKSYPEEKRFINQTKLYEEAIETVVSGELCRLSQLTFPDLSCCPFSLCDVLTPLLKEALRMTQIILKRRNKAENEYKLIKQSIFSALGQLIIPSDFTDRPYLTDLAAFTADLREGDTCLLSSMRGSDVADITKWEIFDGHSLEDLFKLKLLPPKFEKDKGIVEICTFNSRADGKTIPEASERRAKLKLAGPTVLKGAMSESVRSSVPHLVLKPLQRGFAEPGDSGSLLYARRASEGGVIGVVIGIARSRNLLSSEVHGFYIQPALDVIASELFLKDAARAVEQNKKIIGEAYEEIKRKIMQKRKNKESRMPRIFDAKKKLQIGDLLLTYEPCLNDCNSLSGSLHEHAPVAAEEVKSVLQPSILGFRPEHPPRIILKKEWQSHGPKASNDSEATTLPAPSELVEETEDMIDVESDSSRVPTSSPAMDSEQDSSVTTISPGPQLGPNGESYVQTHLDVSKTIVTHGEDHFTNPDQSLSRVPAKLSQHKPTTTTEEVVAKSFPGQHELQFQDQEDLMQEDPKEVIPHLGVHNPPDSHMSPLSVEGDTPQPKIAGQGEISVGVTAPPLDSAIPATRTKQPSAEIPKNVMAKETHEPHHSPSTKAVQTTGTVEQAAPDPAAVAPPPTHTHLSRKN